jgi:hypothetical protein
MALLTSPALPPCDTRTSLPSITACWQRSPVPGICSGGHVTTGRLGNAPGTSCCRRISCYGTDRGGTHRCFVATVIGLPRTEP